jgi:hypothetical protein
MKKINNPGRRKLLVWAVALLVTLGIGGGCYASFGGNTRKTAGDTQQPASGVNYGPPTKDDIKAGEQIKQEVISRTTDPQPQQDTITISLVRADQADAGEPLNVRLQIDGTTGGDCKIMLTKAGSPDVKKSFPVVREANTVYCQNADIDADEFSQAGTWSLQAYVQNGDKISNTITQAVVIKK